MASEPTAATLRDCAQSSLHVAHYWNFDGEWVLCEGVGPPATDDQAAAMSWRWRLRYAWWNVTAYLAGWRHRAKGATLDD